jgi:hypothetical protein
VTERVESGGDLTTQGLDHLPQIVRPRLRGRIELDHGGLDDSFQDLALDRTGWSALSMTVEN